MSKELSESEQEIHDLAKREGITRAAAAERIRDSEADTELDDQ